MTMTTPDGANGITTTTAQPTAEGTQETAADVAGIESGAADAGAWRNMGEIKKALASQRDLDRIVRNEILPALQALKAPAATVARPTVQHRAGAASPTASANGEGVAELRAELAAMKRDHAATQAFADLGIKPGPQRELLEMALRAQQPANVREFVEKYHGAIQPPQVAPPVPRTLAATGPVVPTNTGAPNAQSRQELSGSPFALTPEQVHLMSGEQIRDHYNGWRTKTGANHNPMAAKVLKRFAAQK